MGKLVKGWEDKFRFVDERLTVDGKGTNTSSKDIHYGSLPTVPRSRSTSYQVSVNLADNQ